MSKQQSWLWSITLLWQPIKKKEIYEIKPIALLLEKEFVYHILLELPN